VKREMPFLLTAHVKSLSCLLRFFWLLFPIRSIRQPNRKETAMAKPNYQFKKRQKELNRLKKKEEKRQRKQENKDIETNETKKTPDPFSEDL